MRGTRDSERTGSSRKQRWTWTQERAFCSEREARGETRHPETGRGQRGEQNEPSVPVGGWGGSRVLSRRTGPGNGSAVGSESPLASTDRDRGGAQAWTLVSSLRMRKSQISGDASDPVGPPFLETIGINEHLGLELVGQLPVNPISGGHSHRAGSSPTESKGRSRPVLPRTGHRVIKIRTGSPSFRLFPSVS